MYKSYLSLIALLIVFTSSNCKKNNNNTTPLADTYQPTTAGSEWNYTITGSTVSAGTINYSYKLTATAKDTTANGKTYKVFTSTTGVNEYFLKTGNDYYRIGTFAGIDQKIEALYLKDNLTVGGTWSDTKSVSFTGVPVPVPVTVTFTLMSNKYDTSFNGMSFKDVLRIKATPSITGFAAELNDIYYFYAKNVGMIANKVRLKASSVSIDANTETKLTSYTIK